MLTRLPGNALRLTLAGLIVWVALAGILCADRPSYNRPLRTQRAPPRTAPSARGFSC